MSELHLLIKQTEKSVHKEEDIRWNYLKTVGPHGLTTVDSVKFTILYPYFIMLVYPLLFLVHYYLLLLLS